jgi:alpha-L-fucosidase
MTIGKQWAWKPGDEVKTAEECLQSLIRSAGGDGNFLFNVGPRPDGAIDPLQAERLREMGRWLGKYGYSVYGTRGGPFRPSDWGVSTRKGNKIYLHILKWYGNTVKISLPYINTGIKSCKLADGGKITIEKLSTGYEIKFDAKYLKPVSTIVELKVEGNTEDIRPADAVSQ